MNKRYCSSLRNITPRSHQNASEITRRGQAPRAFSSLRSTSFLEALPRYESRLIKPPRDNIVMTDEHEPIPNAPDSTTGTFEPEDSQSDAESAASNLSTNTYCVGLKEELLAALSNIQASGSFASFAGISNTPPALFVDGVGDVTMPLSESQARQLIARAHQAPNGKRSETLVDTAVRNTWELDAEQFTFRDPAWAGFIKSLCAHTSQRLGINTPIRAEIYKMLVYEKCAMFKAHTE